jgi:5-methylcytosine-specific restriction endonuclease McrA
MPSIAELLESIAAKSKPKRKLADGKDKAVRDAFYNSRAWKAARYQAIKRHGGKCQACGATANDGVKICADHIKSLFHHWELRLEPTNIQVLCNDCNFFGKGRHDETDWRPKEGEPV